jgi:TRAP-type mannitol/chloroaromatic compound transport system substrate-binding protein
MPRAVATRTLAALIALALAGCIRVTDERGAAGARGPAVRLRVQSGFGFVVPVLGDTIVHFDQLLEAQRPAGLEVEVYDAEKLVPTLSIFDAVSAGKIDAGFAFPGYWLGKVPSATVFAAVPFGPDTPELIAWLQHGGGMEIWRRIYAKHGVVPLLCGALPPEASGWFRAPIESAADLVGKKIRYAGLGGKVLEKLGASITMLSAGDLFVSLERGVIDATEYSMPAVDRPLGFYKVAKHYYFPGWHQPSSVLELAVNAKTWERLAPEHRAVLETTCAAATTWGYTRGLAIEQEALAFFRAEGVELHTWPPELMAQLRRAADEVMQEASASDPDFAEAWASLQRFRASHAEWASIAYPE